MFKYASLLFRWISVDVGYYQSLGLSLLSLACLFVPSVGANPAGKLPANTVGNSSLNDVTVAKKTEEVIDSRLKSNCPNFTPLQNVQPPQPVPENVPIDPAFSPEQVTATMSPTSFCAADLTDPSSNAIAETLPPVTQTPTNAIEPESPNTVPNSGAEPESPNTVPDSGAESEEKSNNNQWQFIFQPYGTIPVTTYGSATVRGNTVNYHLGLGKLLDNLRLTASGRMEAWNNNLGFIVDGFYVSLQGGGITEFRNFPNASLKSTLRFDQGIYDFAVSYNLGSPPHSLWSDNASSKFPLISFQPIVGVRLNDINSTLDTELNFGRRIERTVEASVSGGRTWFEPMVGGKLNAQLSEPMTLWLRGDASGFGLAGDTDMSWNLLFGMDWWIRRNISLQLAYRFYSIKYQNGSGDNTFGFEESFNGPYLAASFYFN